jgi:phenylacetate-coenzyme A ligase PaaK-like adenylate-forming protein
MTDYDSLRARHQASFRALLPEYLERARWPVEKLRAAREAGLRCLLAVAKAKSPFHARRLTGIDPATATEADLERIPVMTKDEMMGSLDQVLTDERLSRDALERHLQSLETDAYLFDEYHVFASGGSTGRRGIFVYDWDGWMHFGLALARFGIQERARTEWPSPPIEALIAAPTAAHMTGAGTFIPTDVSFHRLPATLPIPEIVARLNALKPDILRGYPNTLAALAVEALQGRLNIAPRFVRAHSEPLVTEARRLMERAWGRPVTNGYGTTEGACAISCGLEAAMHINEDMCIFEFVDADGRPVPAGTRCSAIYVTNLANHVQPLIRYCLDDELTLNDAPCPCGSTLRRIEDIQGKCNDPFVYANDVVVHPLIFISPIFEERHLIDYQVRQTRDGAAVTLRASGDVDAGRIAGRIERALAELGLRAPRVSVERVDAIETSSAGKVRRFIPLS